MGAAGIDYNSNVYPEDQGYRNQPAVVPTTYPGVQRNAAGFNRVSSSNPQRVNVVSSAASASEAGYRADRVGTNYNQGGGTSITGSRRGGGTYASDSGTSRRDGRNYNQGGGSTTRTRTQGGGSTSYDVGTRSGAGGVSGYDADRSASGGRRGYSGGRRTHDESDHYDDIGLYAYGKPGINFPLYASAPDTGFSCRAQQFPGYYADTESQCQVCS